MQHQHGIDYIFQFPCGVLSSRNNCAVTWPCPTHRSAAAGRSGNAKLTLWRLAGSGTLLASRSYCKGCHSQNTSHLLFAQRWSLEAPAHSAVGGKHYNLHEDRAFSSPGGMPSSLVTFQLPFGMAGWWAGASICSGWEASLSLSLCGGKGLNSGVRTDEVMS